MGLNHAVANVPAQEPDFWYFLSLEPVVRALKRHARDERAHFPTTNNPTRAKATAKMVVDLHA